MEILIETFKSVLTVENGIFSFGWILAIFLLWRSLANKDDYVKAADALRVSHVEEMKGIRAEYDRRIEENQDSFLEELSKLHGELNEHQSKHIDLITAMSEKRIEDLKSITEDYNKVTDSVMQTMEKLTKAVISNKRKP